MRSADAGGEPDAAADAWLRHRELFGIRPGLGRMRLLLDRLDRPETRFDAIHVVGSNGKTSTVTMAAAMLARPGTRVGAYVSPHLVAFRERIHVDGRPLSPEAFAAAVAQTRAAAEAMEADPALDLDGPVTQFEAVTAAAFVALADAGVDCAVIEAGLGGRWDATNVLPAAPPSGSPAVAVLTSVSLEHTRWLGHTVAEIATEKVEVLRPGGVLVLAAGLPAEAREVADRVAAERGATVVVAPPTPGGPAGTVSPAAPAAIPVAGASGGALPVPRPVHGVGRPVPGYQRANLATAVMAVTAYRGEAADPDGAAVRAAGRIVVPGRFEVVEGGAGVGPGDASPGADAAGPDRPRGPIVIHDGAHNPAGFAALADAVAEAAPPRPIVVLLGVLDDKDPSAMVARLERVAETVVVAAPRNPRALDAGRLAAVVTATLPDVAVHVASSAHDGLARARTLAGPEGTVLVTGSLHLVAELRRGAQAPPGAAF
ncbi:MAG: folylpolyglutamate synthase/dihydrofolate synthase family protein [Solirubrobacteraceae bacterium]